MALDSDMMGTGTHTRRIVPCLHAQKHLHVHVGPLERRAEHRRETPVLARLSQACELPHALRSTLAYRR